jgi:hypothetical protein
MNSPLVQDVITKLLTVTAIIMVVMEVWNILKTTQMLRVSGSKFIYPSKETWGKPLAIVGVLMLLGFVGQDIVLLSLWWIAVLGIFRFIQNDTITVFYRSTLNEVKYIKPVFGGMVVIVPIPTGVDNRPNQYYLIFSSQTQGSKVRAKIYGITVSNVPVNGFVVHTKISDHNKIGTLIETLRNMSVFTWVKPERKN